MNIISRAPLKRKVNRANNYRDTMNLLTLPVEDQLSFRGDFSSAHYILSVEDTMRNLFNIIILVTLFSLIGCKSTTENPTWDAEVNAKLKTNDVSEDTPQDIQKVQYLARRLMGARAQDLYQADMSNEVVEWDMTSVSASFIGSSLITGNPFSTSGTSTAAGLGVALDVVTFFANGSDDDIAQMWMPSVSNDGENYTAKTATEAARKEVDFALIESYKEVGITLTCLSLCDDFRFRRIYTANLSADTIASLKAQGYTYVPEIIQVKATLIDMIEIKTEDKIETLALGFKPGYKSHINGFVLEMSAGIKYTDAGEPIVITYSDEKDYKEYVGAKPLTKTKLGRQILRNFSKKVPWVYGTKDRKKGRNIAYNGIVHGWKIATSTRFIEEEILD